ncbi:MAG: 50S ribosomal protein L25 [Vicinamibacterales bacterium]
MEALLDATVRTTIGKNEARRTRREGKVPAVVYGAASEGASRDAVSISVEPKALLKILHSEAGANTLISLKLEGADTKVLVKDFQLDPVTHQVLHADFYRVAMDRMIEVTIPILIKGEPKGVKLQGGLLEFIRREIQIECLPADIPEHVDVDVTELMVGQGVRLRDVANNPKWRAITEAETMLVHVILAKAEEAATTATPDAVVATGSEPEVIKKGKKDEEAEKADKKK